jgi:hypothetical protein
LPVFWNLDCYFAAKPKLRQIGRDQRGKELRDPLTVNASERDSGKNYFKPISS